MPEYVDQAQVDAFWVAFCEEQPAAAAAGFSAWAFGDNPDLANELAHLVKTGLKTATCGSLLEMQATGEEMPRVGGYSIILDGQGQPVCIIRTDDVIITAFNEVGADFAFDEGENDRSLTSWREGHWKFFTRIHAVVNLEMNDSIPLVCERFHKVFPV